MFSVVLIFCSIGIGIVSLYPYYQRMGQVLIKEETDQVKKERIYRTMFTIFGSIILLVQFLIAVFIIKGTRQAMHNNT